MIRLFENNLKKWKDNGMNKPLMVIGVRQIGKTYTIDKFCKENFDNYLYFNIEKSEWIKNIFETTIDSDSILSAIELKLEKKIDLDKTIFFFDEVQVSERCITSLKYFSESSKPFKIICAGSLLGIKINRFNSSFPVGKVRMECMYPMNFEEFLMALNKNMLLDKIKECYKTMKSMDSFAHDEAIELYRKYLCIGGMPESINDYILNNKDILLYDSKIISNIIDMYIADMNKYTLSNIESVKIEKIYKNISSQLANENKKFKYSVLEESAKKRKYETAIDWLVASNMVLSCYNVKRPEIPLKVYVENDTFKLYLSDVGLLTNISEIKFYDILLNKSFIFKGAITENYIAQELRSKDISLYYWTSSRKAKIDYLLYNKDGIIPVEVKSNDNITSKSLNFYIDKYKPKYSIRISLKNFGFENNIKSIPLYAVFCIADDI
ncbi:MAG: DUF4143 domain-containing protein [Clostridia bacterium]